MTSTQTTDRRFIADPESDMPVSVQRIHYGLNTAACRCYALRNAAEHYGDVERAAFYHETGDRFFSRSLALTAEWETFTS